MGHKQSSTIQSYALAMRHFLNLYTLMLCFIIMACNGSKYKEVDEKSAKFTTSDASELFFKNVRSIQYDKAVMGDTKLDVYRFKEQVEAEDRPILNLSIVVNWRYDEAYVLTEPNAFLQSLDTIKIMWQDTVAQENGTYQFSNGNKAEHFQLAVQLYRSIQDQRALYILNDDQQIPFMRRRDEREAFRKSMVDYLRLVDLL
ncbi:hypothetical protein OKW21_006389 [Catalinimonas alkaloidigena]|uniref:hypothetical protein n=1 Tax=Catalinimonas alkaloidigena TaxID=1075417 RepID=UPI002406675D|nr:hypothetical protein [Catalinimonas alkaloidigena]MDF9801126.1 hypothetical protein [Catalinimonas alkaloidigena]